MTFFISPAARLRRAIAGMFLCLFAIAAAHADSPAAPQGPTLALTGGLWFDGERFVPAAWYAVGGRLTATRPERIDATVDLAGRYVLPPFVEAHNHDMQNAGFAAVSIGKNLRQGVFYSVQMCSKPGNDRAFSRLFNTPGTIDILYAEACISSSDGHPLGISLASYRQAGIEPDADEARARFDPIDSLEDFERLWPEIAAREPALIKVILVNSERQAANRADPDTFGFRGIDPELLAPIVARAREAGIRVAVHVDSAGDFATAVAAGPDMIVHLPGYRFARGFGAADYRIADDVAAEAARRGIFVITTANVASFSARQPWAAELRAMQIENLRLLREVGVPLIIGSDNVMGTVVDEVLYLDGLQIMPRAELLRRATIDTAEAMFPGREIGAFREGVEASLIAFDADPLETPDVLRSPAVRIRQGSLLAN
ncbi:MAG: amidohydrolase family protein [Sphingomonas sp.]|nr:amidohydrolase family protein [Sphingomonas sp.]